MSDEKQLPQANMNCLERGSHAMRLCHRGSDPYATSEDIANRILWRADDVSLMVSDSAILGRMIEKLFMEGATPEDVARWMVDNGAPQQMADAFMNRDPMPWKGRP
jgi:hypothetical protein